MDTKSNKFYTCKICIPAEIRELYSILKKYALHNNGLIFGGYVRDEIIIQHYSKKYKEYSKKFRFDHNKRKSLYHNYWNKNEHIETKARTILPKDIDIFFNNYKNYLSFLDDIKNKFINAELITSLNENETKIFYIDSSIKDIIDIKKYTLKLLIGNSLFNTGTNITVNMDIIIPKNVSDILNIEPPFFNADLLCNVLVETKSDNIRLSNCIGKPLNYISYYEKSILTTNIMKNIINFNTEIIKKYENYDYNYYYNDIRRYLSKLYDSDFKWTINNLPYELKTIADIKKEQEINEEHQEKKEDKENKEDDEKELCCICQDKLLNLSDNEYIATLSFSDKINNSYLKLHHKCLISSINYQCNQASMAREEDKIKFIIKSPYNIEINFKRCYKNINWNKYLQLE